MCLLLLLLIVASLGLHSYCALHCPLTVSDPLGTLSPKYGALELSNAERELPPELGYNAACDDDTLSAEFAAISVVSGAT